MSDNRDIFRDEWHDCLYAHYRHVIRTHDTVTEPTLRHVLRQTGLSDSELDSLRAQVLNGEDPAVADIPAEVEPESVPEASLEVPAEVEPDIPADEVSEDDDEPPISPAQLSMF